MASLRWLPRRVRLPLAAAAPCLARRTPRVLLGFGLAVLLPPSLSNVIAKETPRSSLDIPQVAEPQTGLAFPAWLSDQQLLATTCRTQYGGFSKLYAVALYLSPEGKKQLSSFLAFSPSQWEQRSAEFLRALIQGPFRKSLWLKMCRETNVQTLIDEWQAGMTRAEVTPSPGWAGFCDLLHEKAASLPTGAELQLTAEEGTLRVAVDGVPLGQVEKAPETCHVLFDMYLGRREGDDSFKRAVRNAFVSWAQQ